MQHGEGGESGTSGRALAGPLYRGTDGAPFSSSGLHTKLRIWAASARYLFERLPRDSQSVASQTISATNDDDVYNMQLHKWMKTVSKGGSRLAWLRYLTCQGLDEALATEALRHQSSHDLAPLPEWAVLLEEVVCRSAEAKDDGSVRRPRRSRDADQGPQGTNAAVEPQPFEELWAPFVAVFRRQMASRAPLGTPLLTSAARLDLEQALLNRLSRIGLSAAYSRFRGYRSERFGPLALFASPDSDTLYKDYVREEAESRLTRLFDCYPVLARRLATRTLRWIQAQAEMVERLRLDTPSLARQFFGGAEPGRVRGIVPGVSDFHRGGRSVAILHFESGVRLVYKPRPLGIEAAFNEFLESLNREGAPCNFRVLEVLDRGEYGWVEFAEPLCCSDRTGATRYYERMGALLAVLYLLHGTDYHFGNVIASGEFPVAVDHECLMSPGQSLFGQDRSSDVRRENYWQGHSVSDIGILPFGYGTPLDRSVLGAYVRQSTKRTRPECRHPNTDAMALVRSPYVCTPEKNVMCIAGKPVYPRPYRESIVEGFSLTYRFLVQHRDRLREPESALSRFRDERIRVIIRDSEWYVDLLERASTPSRQQSGIDFSLAIEYVARTYVDHDLVPGSWQLLSGERSALLGDEVPVFRLSTTDTILDTDTGTVMEGPLRRKPYDDVVSRFLELSEYDLAWQVRLIRASFDSARNAPGTISSEPKAKSIFDVKVAPGHQSSSGKPIRALTPSELESHALTLARVIEGCALRLPTGGTTWIGPQFDSMSDRTEIRPLSGDLLAGTAGIAVFLAAIAASAGCESARQHSLAALEPIRLGLAEGRVLRQRPTEGVGGGVGRGSDIYSLYRVGQFLEDADLIREAEAAIRFVNPAEIGADRHFDLIRGVAGTILALLDVYEATGSTQARTRAVECAQHLIAHRQADGHGRQAWDIARSGRLRTGFAHGAAGIAYALLRLHYVCGDDALRAAAEQAIAFEDSVYDRARGFWPLYGGNDASPETSSENRFLSTWCNGSPGIGLGRAAALQWLDTPQMRADVDAAMTTTINALRFEDDDANDDVCCGAFGRIECVFSSGYFTGKTEWVREAELQAAVAMARARTAGSFRLRGLLDDIWPPLSFHYGLAGIGYQLLRLSDPKRFPSVLLWS